MFRNRKRKVSPDKKPEKTKKLKVSSKIFRSPSSTKTNSDAKAKLSQLLPEGYDSIILTANTKPVESFEENVAVFGCVRLPILTKEDAMVWVKKFERKTFTTYRTQRTWKKDADTGLFKRKYICNVRIKDMAGQAAVVACKGSIIFTIKDQEEIQANPDYYLRDYPSQVIIHFCHNHKIDPDNYMKNLRPSAELRIIFGTYFAKGHSPFSALICHKSDLHSSYGAEFYSVVSNGAICPSYNWCFHEYEKFFMRKFIEPPEDKLNEKLRDTVSQFNGKWRSECAMISYNPLFVLSICTPLMKSIFKSGFAEELITVRCFSTPKTVPKRQKLILFLCHTPIGSLPFGVVVTFAEDTKSVCEGIRALIKMFGVTTYNPKTIIIDENALLSKALKKCFPKAQILFNEFQMLQSIWRIIRVVCANDDDEEFQALYNLCLVTLNSNSEEEFNKNFDSLLVYAEKYPKLTSFLKYFKVRSNCYVFYARPKIEFNTDVLNYTDSGTVILQDVSIKYGNFFNILQLFDFLSKSYVDHYERKLKKIVEGDLKGFFKTNFYVPLSKIADFTCEKISDTDFLVSLNEMRFFVNAELDTCTCQVGVHGGSCVHQYIVEKNLGLVPECYTPLCDDMLEIFKNILKEKNIRPPLPDGDRLSELGGALDSLKSELESLQDPDDFSDVVSSVCCSEISNFSGMPHDMDHLGPLDEIFLVPPDITDSFTDITDEIMSPLVLSEFDDTNEDNEDFFDDSQQYNRESGELEPIEGSRTDTKTFQEDIIEGFSANLEQSIPTAGLFLNQDNAENVIIYEYTEDDIKCNNEVEIVGHGNTVEGETLVQIPSDGSILLGTGIAEYNITENITTDIGSSVIYTYSNEGHGQVTFNKNVMTENDRKTAEIAEFLTNLPDTNNSNNHPDTARVQYDITNLFNTNNTQSQNINTIPYTPDRDRMAHQERTISNGVVVVKNEEYFTNYRVLENNVLSDVTSGPDAGTNNGEQDISNSESYDDTSQHSAQNLIADSYEENNFIMMSPNDLFDDNQNVESDVMTDKQDLKINVLSSVVIKAPHTYIPNLPLNLNSIKHKTLRNVKEDSRTRLSVPKIVNNDNTIFIHDPTTSEPRKIVLPIVVKKKTVSCPDLVEIRNNDGDKTFEKDVIKLYCNQSGEVPTPQDNEEKELNTYQQDAHINKIQLDETGLKKMLDENSSQIRGRKFAQSESGSEDFDEDLSDIEFSVPEFKQKVPRLAEIQYDSRDDTQECNNDLSDSKSVSQICDSSPLNSERLMLVDYNPEELANNEFVEIVEIDSDGLEELASQKYDPALISCEIPSNPTSSKSLLSQKSSFKVLPLTNDSSKVLPFKSSPNEKASTSYDMSLTDFMTKKLAPSNTSLQQKLSSKETWLENTSMDEYKDIQDLVTTTFQSQSVMSQNKLKEKVKKILNESTTTYKLGQNRKENNDTVKDNLDILKYSENKEKISNKKKGKNSGLNIIQTKSIKKMQPLTHKNIKGNVPTSENKTNIVEFVDETDSNETGFSDFEDVSNSFESDSSWMDELSEDELYELEYLWREDSSGESIDNVDLNTMYKKCIARELTDKPGVKKTDIPINSNHQTDEKCGSTSKKSDQSVNHDVCNISNNCADLKKHVKGNLPQNINPKKTYSNKQQKNKLKVRAQKYQFYDDGFGRIINTDSPSDMTRKHEDELSPKSNMKSSATSLKVIEKPISEIDSEANNEDVSSKLGHLNISYKAKKEVKEKQPLQRNKNLNQKTKKINNKEVETSKTLADVKEQNSELTTDSAQNQSEITPKKPSHHLVLTEKSENVICSDQKFKNDIKLTRSRILQKINPKIINRKILNTTLKLDSLPSILSQPYSQRVSKVHRAYHNAGTSTMLTDLKSDTNVKGNTAKTYSKTTVDNVKIIAIKNDIDECSMPLKTENDLLLSSPLYVDPNIDAENGSQDDRLCIKGSSNAKNDREEDLHCIKERFKAVKSKMTMQKNKNKKGIKQNSNRKRYDAKDTSFENSLLLNNSLTTKIPKLSLKSSFTLATIEAIGNQRHGKNVKELKSSTSTVSQMRKDINDLEAILTSDKDNDRELNSVVNNKKSANTNMPSILQNDDLSFLFDDPRIETVVEEETLPKPMSLLGVSGSKKKIRKKFNRKLTGDNPNTITSQKTNLVHRYPNALEGIPLHRPLRKILPKGEVPENITKLESTSPQRVKKRDINTQSNIVYSLENGNYLNQRQYVFEASTSENNRNKLKPKRKKTALELNEKKNSTYRTQYSRSESISSRVNTFSIGVKERSKKKVEKATKPLKNLKDETIDWVNPRLNDGGKIILTTKAGKQELKWSKEEIIDKNVKMKSESRVAGSSKKDSLIHKNTRQLSDINSRSKIAQSLTLTKTTNLIERKRASSLRAVKKKELGYTDDSALINNSKKQKILPKVDTIATDYRDCLVSKKEKVNTQADSKNAKIDAKKSSHKISPLQAGTETLQSSLHQAGSVSKLRKASTRKDFSNPSTASSSLNYESDDFENSIVASVLEKKHSPRRPLKAVETKRKGALIASTPRKSIGYEDAFKIFLETSNRGSANKDESLSDVEKGIEDSDWELHRESRRRTKSVSSGKGEIFDNMKPIPAKIKKSVSWAEGLNVIEYIRESDTDSDDSEIRHMSKKNEIAREKRKEIIDEKPLKYGLTTRNNASISQQKDRTIMANHNKNITKSRSRSCVARLRINDPSGEKTNQSMSSTLIFQENQASFTHIDDSFTLGNRLRRSRSVTPKRGIVKTTAGKRSRSYTRNTNFRTKLVVLLERNKEIDEMCLTLVNRSSVFLRSRRGGRVGYKELLHRARLSKSF